METMQGNVSPGDTKYFALQVALQTMKERCIQLQRRLSSVEEENQKLREDSRLPTETLILKGIATEVELQMQVDDLQRQKTRLTERVNMVSDENRKLWSRLSQLSKEQVPNVSGVGDGQNKSVDTEASEIELHNIRDEIAGVNQNLIRSKTFTQHSPNPHLRPKLIADRSTKDMSMEEIVLHATGAGDAYASDDEAELGFPYMQVIEDKKSNSHETDFNTDAKRCMEGMQELLHEALKHKKDLATALKTLEINTEIQPCPKCAERAHKPETADKSLETDESLSEPKNWNDKKTDGQMIATINDTTNGGQNGYTTPTQVMPTSRLNLIQEKINADALDKTCPMCGKLYTSNVSFKAFQDHVEMHFIEDTSLEMESSIERNFEFISHAVGDF